MAVEKKNKPKLEPAEAIPIAVARYSEKCVETLDNDG